MTTEEALLAAIWASPHDDLPRLVYADYLDETGDPAMAARAEFIRVQCELARMDEDDPSRAEREKREQQLWNQYRRTWRAGFPSPFKSGMFHRGFPHADQQSVTGKKFLDFPKARLDVAPLWEFNLSELSGEMIPAIAAAPAMSRTSQFMIWSAMPGFGPESVGQLVGGPQARNLETLGLNRQPIGDEGLTALTGLTETPHLRELYLGETGVTDKGVRRLCRWVQAENLTDLMLDGNSLTDASLDAIIRCGMARRLQSVLLGQNPALTTKGVVRFLKATRDLRLLNLSYSDNVTDEVADTIAHSPNLGQLRQLILPNTRITDRGVLALAKSPHLPRLRMINLFGCRIRRDRAAARELRTRFGNYF